ncbi:hypothetical protein [Acrocarpospora catenulata]|uniref:hypothetical protein n=1 Tax=Acrocarpospora catenulata TaxID=2836182 RepID=UPI001BD9382E|nr:hypothetical protein [Acrocarpospora catenulata]
MFAGKLVRRALALASVLVTTGAAIAAIQQPAAAVNVTLQATVDCTASNYSGNTSDWYPNTLAVVTSPPTTSTPVPGGSLVANPANHSYQFSQALPSGATSVTINAKCSSGHQYDLYGVSNGSAGIPAGYTTVTASWACATAQVYPGPYVTNCSLQSVSYS